MHRLRARRDSSVLLAIAMVLAACGTGGESDDSAGSRRSDSVQAVVEASGPFTPTGDEVAVVEGVGAVYSGSVVDVPADIEAVSAEDPEPVVGVLATGPGMHVDVPESVEGAFELHLTVPKPPNDTALPGVLHRRDDGSYVVEPALWNPDTGTVITFASDFSDRWGAWYDPRNWVEETVQAGEAVVDTAVTVVGGTIDFVADFMTGRTDPPPCGNDPPDWSATSVTEAASVHVCTQTNSEQGRVRSEILLKSNRRTAQVVTVPSQPKDYVWLQGQDNETYRKALAWGAGVDAGSNVVLLGQHEMSLGFPRPAFSTSTDMRLYQTPPIIILNPLLAAVGDLPLKGVAALAMASYKCTQEFSGIDISKADVAPSDLGSLPEAMGKAIRCAFELIQNPELVVGLAREALEAIGIKGSEAQGFLDEIGSGARRIAPTAKRIAGVLAGGAVLTTSWDGIFDNVAEGLITTELTGTLSDDVLLTLAECEGPCEVSGRVSIDHPRWGRTHLITIESSEQYGNFCATRILFAVDDTGAVVWDSGATRDGCPWYAMAPAGQGDHGSEVTRPIDASGRIFFDWDPGRYNGVAVLTITEDGFDDHGTLPAPDYGAARFYYSNATDRDGDGVYEIDQQINSCVPSCAGAPSASTLYRWDGSDFEGVVPAPGTRCGNAYIGRAEGFGEFASDLAYGIEVTGVTCVEAVYGDQHPDDEGESLVQRLAHGNQTPFSGDTSYRIDGWACTVTDIEGGAFELYDCVADQRRVSFERYVE